MPVTSQTRPTYFSQPQPTHFRGPLPTGDRQADIELEGGDHSAGMIRAAAIITRGEALGHKLWIDRTMLEQTRDAINQPAGAKARFTHPGSGDAMGKFLGRFKNATLDGDTLRADLHFSKSAHETPGSGNLASYLMSLAAEDPAAFGNSIAFLRDAAAESRFEQHYTAMGAVQEKGQLVQRKTFTSPDSDNSQNFRHARLSKLLAVDTVDTPAANPNGMFEAGDIEEMEQVLSYICGLSGKPETSRVDADLAKGFVTGFLARHNLTIQAPAATGNADASEGDVVTVDPAADFAARHKKFTDAFGAASGNQWLAEGKSFEEASSLHAAAVETTRTEELAAKDKLNAELTAQVEDLQSRIDQAAAATGEAEGVDFNAEGEQPQVPARFANLPDGVARFAAGLKSPSTTGQ